VSKSLPELATHKSTIIVCQFPHAFTSETILAALVNLDSDFYAAEDQWQQRKSELEAVLRMRDRAASHDLRLTMMPPIRSPNG
jgi:hypothetical protein